MLGPPLIRSCQLKPICLNNYDVLITVFGGLGYRSMGVKYKGVRGRFYISMYSCINSYVRLNGILTQPFILDEPCRRHKTRLYHQSHYSDTGPTSPGPLAHQITYESVGGIQIIVTNDENI